MGAAPKAKREAKKRDGLSGPDAAAKVLVLAGRPMNTKEIVEKMLADGLWKTGGKPPGQPPAGRRRRPRGLGRPGTPARAGSPPSAVAGASWRTPVGEHLSLTRTQLNLVCSFGCWYAPGVARNCGPDHSESEGKRP
jgi:hypothetical protein